MLQLTSSVLSMLFLASSPVAPAYQPAGSEIPVQDQQKRVCQYVLASDPGALPYQLCQTKAEWAALEAASAKDANRMVCRYEEIPGTRTKGHKMCGTQSAWEARKAEAREAVETIQRNAASPR
jgi:hypothetical protein